MRLALAVLGTVCLSALPARAQARSQCWTPGQTVPNADRTAAANAARSVNAGRVKGPSPVIDGELLDQAWCDAEPATDFVQTNPAPGALATLPTAARVLFDDDAVYVAVRLFDTHPDSLVAPYPRRDDEVTSDWVFVEIDTRFDHRSGFSFGLNPRGVQVDGTWWNDVTYDPAWNGVWQGAAHIDANGWTVEFRIPFSQLALARSAPGASLTWGLNIYRYTPHRGESANWSPRLPSVVGVVSHFNRLEGLVAPPRSRPIELLPYGSITTVEAPSGRADELKHRVGADVRVRPTSTSSASLSVHPDFGQVEADPSQVNLTTFETFLTEARPIFVEGADVFQFPSGLAFTSRGRSFAEESPFYSRRVGRPPQAPPPSGIDAPTPDATTVIAAARGSFRSESGWSGGVLHAWTGAERTASADSTGTKNTTVQLEPLTSFSVARAMRESRDGNSGIGFMLTAVNRLHLSTRLDSLLPRTAATFGTDVRKRWAGHELTTFVLGSRVEGDGAAIGLLRAQTRHGYARAASVNDATSPNDTVHRALVGLAAQTRLARTTGNLLWGIAGRLVTRGFEANDAGFQRNADWVLLSGDWKYQRFHPGALLRRWSLGSSGLGLGWTTGGERRAGIASLTAGGDLRNYWGGSVTAAHELESSDPEVLRGGPTLLLPERDRISTHLYSDTRRAWQLTLDASGEREAGSRSRRLTLAPGLDAFVTDKLRIGVAPRVAWIREGWQYVAQAERLTSTTAAPLYILGRLGQREVSLTTRATRAFSPHLTLQWYAEAFLSGGQYGGFAIVADPRARRASDRVSPIVASRLAYDSSTSVYRVDTNSPAPAEFRDPAFSTRSLNVNTVLRWEFLPGSTLFAVWTQERGDPTPTPLRLGGDLRRLTRAAPTNALQLKVSYWFTP